MPGKGQMYKSGGKSLKKKIMKNEGGAVKRGNNAAKRRAKEAMMDKKAGKK